jgi:aminoglycoside phosphotransferase (APT) family kinase protein
MTAEVPVAIDAALVGRLIADQFPQWSALPVDFIVDGGWDNRAFRLGEELVVRLPSGAGYAPQVEKEQRWLPVLADRVPLPIPEPVGQGAPGGGYPFPWSVYRWIPGQVADRDTIDDLAAFADDLAGFLRALQHVPAEQGPPPGQHSAHRGGPLEFYDDDFRRALRALGSRVPTELCLLLWHEALEEPRLGDPVWFHGDVAIGNLLVRGGRLAAVIDFGCSGVGDPACDLAVAWSLFDPASRTVFRTALRPDDATWARGRGWALWKALITVADEPPEGRRSRLARRALDELLRNGAVGTGQ